MATVAELQAELAKWEAARDKALDAQSYGIAGRSKTMAPLKDIQECIDRLRSRIARISNTSTDTVAPTFIPGGD